MAKRNRSVTKRVREKRRKEGRGVGTGKDYKPELRIQDVSSIGLATRVRGWKTGRVHHFLSLLELMVFYLFDWPLRVEDIREQFPLDLDETKAIANELGVRHPRDPKTKELVVMTTDFVVTVRNGVNEVVYSYTVKYAKQLPSRRVMEKFEIERIYWSRRNVSWRIITERDINRDVVANVQWIHSHRDLNSLAPITLTTVTEIEKYLAPRLFSQTSPLRILTDESDRAFSLRPGTSLSVVRHLIANRRIEVDMKTPIQPERILRLVAKPRVLK